MRSVCEQEAVEWKREQQHAIQSVQTTIPRVEGSEQTSDGEPPIRREDHGSQQERMPPARSVEDALVVEEEGGRRDRKDTKQQPPLQATRPPHLALGRERLRPQRGAQAPEPATPSETLNGEEGQREKQWAFEPAHAKPCAQQVEFQAAPKKRE